MPRARNVYKRRVLLVFLNNNTEYYQYNVTILCFALISSADTLYSYGDYPQQSPPGACAGPINHSLAGQLATQPSFGRCFLNTETLGDNIYYAKLISVCFLKVDTQAAALLNPFSHIPSCGKTHFSIAAFLGLPLQLSTSVTKRLKHHAISGITPTNSLSTARNLKNSCHTKGFIYISRDAPLSLHLLPIVQAISLHTAI